MALPYLRDKRLSARNRLAFFFRELYSIEYANNEHCKETYQRDVPPEGQWNEMYNTLSQYHLYLDHQYGGGIGNIYSLRVSNHPVKPHGVFHEHIKDFGPITDFLNDYYGLWQSPASKISIWQKYHKFAKVRYYSPAELAEKLIQLSRELIYRYHIQEFLDDKDCTIRYYDIDFEWNQIGVWLHYKNHKGKCKHICDYLKAV